MVKCLTFAAAAVLCLVTSAASAKTYDCAIDTQGEAQGWIAKQIKVEHGEKITVTDEVIDYLQSSPAEGTLSRESAQAIVFGWEIKSMDVQRQNVRMKYRLTVQKANGQAMISATPLGYVNSFMAQGRCLVS